MGLNCADEAPRREALERFVAARAGARAARISASERLRGGAIQQNYALDVEIDGGPLEGAHALVLRTDAPSQVDASLSRGEEFAVLEVAREAGVTVPEPLWRCDDREVLGRAFYLMRRVGGSAAGHRLVRDPDVERRRDALVGEIGAELARLHAVHPPHPRLEFLAEPDRPPALARIATYRGFLDAIGIPQPELEWGLRWLERHAPPCAEPALCHSDYRTGNLMIENGQVTGILDWEFAAWSDPMEDLGWFCARCWRFGAWQHEAGGLGARAAFYDGYQRVNGAPVDHRRVRFWEVMAAVRWAVIALQQAARHCSGAERSLELALTGRMVPEMQLDMLDGIEALIESPG